MMPTETMACMRNASPLDMDSTHMYTRDGFAQHNCLEDYVQRTPPYMGIKQEQMIINHHKGSEVHLNGMEQRQPHVNWHKILEKIFHISTQQYLATRVPIKLVFGHHTICVHACWRWERMPTNEGKTFNALSTCLHHVPWQLMYVTPPPLPEM